MALLGTLQLDLSAPTDRLSSDLNRAQQIVDRHSQMMARSVGVLTASPLVIKVDDRALTALNKHLTLKEQHLDRVVAKFANTKITPAVDDSALDRLNHNSTQQKAEIKLDTKDLSKSIQSSIKNGFGNSSSLFSGIVSPFKSILRGAFEGAGRDLFSGVSKSFSEAINNALANTIGSTDLVGRKLGEKAVNKFQQVGYQLAAEYPAIGEASSTIQKEIRTSLGERDVAIEANKARGKQAKQKQQDLTVAREGITEERKAAREGVITAEENGLKIYRDLKPLQDEVNRREAPERAKIARIAELRANYPNLSPRSQAKIRVIEARIDRRREEYQPAQDLIDGRMEAAEAQLAMAKDRSAAADAQAILLRRKKQPKLYQNILDEIAPNLPDHLVPKLVSNPNAEAEGERARYNVVENQVYLDPLIHTKLQAGERLTKLEYKTVREELEHAKDLDFGQFAGAQSLSERRLLRKPVKATPAEEAAVALELRLYTDDVKPFERNAKVKTSRAYDRYANESRLEDITNYVGEGGRKFSRQVLDQFKSADTGLSTASEVAKGKGVKLPALGKLETGVKDLKLEHIRLVDEIQKAQAGALSPKEVQKLESDLIAHTDRIVSTRERIKNAGKAVVKVANRQDATKSKTSLEANRGSWDDIISLDTIGSKAKYAATNIGSSLVRAGDRALTSRVNNILTQVPGQPGVIDYGAGVDSLGQLTISDYGKMARLGLQGTAGVAQKAGAFLQGAENVALGLLPGGKAAKKVIQNTALPAAAFATATHFLPGGQVAAHALQGGVQGLLSLPGAGFATAANGMISSTIGSIPMLGGAAGAATSALVSGGIDLATSSMAGLLAPVLGGKLILNAGKTALKAIAPQQDNNKLLIAGQQAAQTAISLPQKLAEPAYQFVEAGRDLLQSAGSKLISQSIEPLYPQLQSNNQPFVREIAAQTARPVQRRIESSSGSMDKSISTAQSIATTSVIVDIQAENISAKEAVEYAKKIQAQTAYGRDKLKEALRSGDKKRAEQIAKLLKHHLEAATSDIDKIRQTLGADAAMGTEAGDQLGQTKSVVTRTSNDLTRSIAKNKLNIETESLSNLNLNPELETLASKIQPIGESDSPRFFDRIAENLPSRRKQKKIDRERDIELNNLKDKRQELREKIKSAQQPQQYFNEIKKAAPPIGSSAEENAVYDRTRSDAFTAAYDARQQARFDGISLHETNNRIRAINKSIAPVKPIEPAKPEPIKPEPIKPIEPAKPIAKFKPVAPVPIVPIVPITPIEPIALIPVIKPIASIKPIELTAPIPDIKPIAPVLPTLPLPPDNNILKFTLADVRRLPPVVLPKVKSNQADLASLASLPSSPKPLTEPVASPTPNNVGVGEDGIGFKYSLFDRIAAYSPFRRRKDRKYNPNQDPFGSGFEAIASASQSQDQFDRAEGSIKDREQKILKQQYGFQGIEKPYDPLKNLITTNIDKAKEKLGGLRDIGIAALGAFAGYTLLTTVGPMLLNMGRDALATASNFEVLAIKLTAASDSIQAGKNIFAQTTAFADKIGTSRSSALETQAAVSGTTFGTELEGDPSQEIGNQITQLSKLRGLSKQETGSLTLALNQTLGRERVSMQEVNQLTQSGGITDARAIAARSLGYTPQQFSKVQESSTGLDPRLFVTSFLRQGINDALLSKGTVEDSARDKEMRFDSNKEKIAGAFGAVVNPAYKGGIDLLNGAIELLSSVSGLAGAALTGFIVKSIIQLGVTVVPLISEYIIYNGLLASSGKYLIQSSVAMAGSLLKMGLWTAGFIAIGDGIAYIMDRLKNQYSDMAKTTNELSDAIDKAEGKKPSSNDGLVKNDKDVVKNDASLIERGGLAAQSAVSGFIQSSSNFGVNTANFLTKLITGKDSVSTGTTPGLLRPVNQSQKNAEDREEQFDKTNNTIKRGIEHTRKVAIPKAAALEKIDIELSAINTERSGLFSDGAPDARKLEDVMSRSAAKYKERQKLASELTPDGSIIQQAVNEAKNKAAKLESEKSNKSISQSAYDSQYSKIQQEIKDATEAQNDFNKAIRNGLDDLTPWTRELSKIAAKFEDINVAADTSTNQFTVVKNKLETTGKITKGQAEYGASQNKDQILVAKNAAIDKTINELKFALNSKDPNAIKNVQKAYGINDSTSSAQLKVLSDTATSPQDKQVLAQLATIRDKRNEQIGTIASISDARAEVYRKIYDENRQAMLYYVSLAQQLDPKNNEFNQAISKISTSKNAFLAKLNNFGSGLFDIYTTAYIALLDAGKEKLESQAKAAQERKAALDAYQNRSLAAQEQDRTRFTPLEKLGKASNGQPVDNANAATKPKVAQGRNPATTPDGRPFTTNNIDPTSATSVRARLGKKPANWVEAGEQASLKVYQQSIINANRNEKLSAGESELKKVLTIQALNEAQIKKDQILEGNKRKRKLERLDPNDDIKQEGKQNRERLVQSNQLDDDKDNKINDVRSLTNSLTNAKLTIGILRAKPNRTPYEDKVLSAAQSNMLRDQNGLKEAQTDLAGFDKLAASKKASLEREQKYQREVTAENNALKEQSDRVDKLKGSLQGLNQQLQSQPFNEVGKASSRTQATEIAKQEADMALVRAKRQITEASRSSEAYTPAMAARDAKIATDIRNKAVQNTAQKQIQESIVSQNAYNAERKGQELTGYNIASNENAIKIKSYQVSEKGDAPFASSMSIEAEFAQKLTEFKKLEAEREKIITKQRIDYKSSTDPTTGNNELLATAEAHNKAQAAQNQDSLNLDRKSNAQSLNQFGIGKRGYEFGQSIKFFDADAAQRASDRDGIKQRGGDTRELDLDLAVRAKQKESAVKVQDLQSQRDAITENSVAAKKARAEIDNLIASTKALAVTDISNISDQFDRFNQVVRKVQDTSQEVFTTWLQTGKFDWRKILLSGLDDALKQLTAKLVPDLFGGLFRKSEKTASTSITEGIAKTLTDGVNPQNAPPSQIANPIVNSALTQQSGVADPIISQPSMVVDGMVKLALPGGGFRTLSREDAISYGFINIDGTSTTAPKPQPQPTINLTPPETFNFNQDDNGQIQQLQQDLFAPQPIIAPPMPLDEFDGLGNPPPGYRRGDNGYDIRRLPMPNRRSDAGGGIGSSLLSMGIPLLTKLLGFADGGIVPADPSFKSAREGDNPIANALKKEGHDAIIAALTPGERILNLRETRIYQTMFPKGISNYNDGGVAGGITPIPLNLDKGKAKAGDNNEFNFSIDNSGKGADGQLSSRQMIDGLRSVVVQELLRQKRNGSGLVN